jgi:hypothetical protein
MAVWQERPPMDGPNWSKASQPLATESLQPAHEVEIK